MRNRNADGGHVSSYSLASLAIFALAVGLPSVAVAARVTVAIGEAAGSAGTPVSFSVTLETQGMSVAGVQADIMTNQLYTPILSTNSYTPNCSVNPSLGKQGSFEFLPLGCYNGCPGIRAVIMSMADSAPIADGSTLYTCWIQIDPGASYGNYPIVAANVAVSDPVGAHPSATSRAGQVQVRQPYTPGGGCTLAGGDNSTHTSRLASTPKRKVSRTTGTAATSSRRGASEARLPHHANAAAGIGAVSLFQFLFMLWRSYAPIVLGFALAAATMVSLYLHFRQAFKASAPCNSSDPHWLADAQARRRPRVEATAQLLAPILSLTALLLAGHACAPAVANAAQQYTNSFDGYSLSYPNAPWEIEPADHAGAPVIIRNFQESKYLPGGGIPRGSGYAEIRVFPLDPAQEEYAELKFSSRFGVNTAWAGTRVAYDRDEPVSGPLRCVEQTVRKGNRLFKVVLSYRIGDTRGPGFEKVHAGIVSTLQLTHP